MLQGLFKKTAKQNQFDPMQVTLQRTDEQLLLICMLMVFVPHFFFMPWSLTVWIAMAFVVWQYFLSVKKSSQRLKNKYTIWILFFCGMAMIYAAYGTFFNIEAGSSFLALAVFAKSFETRTYRDSIILINTLLFLIAGLFLHSQNLLVGLAGLWAALFCFYTLYQLQNDHHAYQDVIEQPLSRATVIRQNLKNVGKLVLVALPLMSMLFMFTPRFPPLWRMPTAGDQAKTGVSDEMSPGDISNLSQSNELAFRVLFPEGQLPDKANLYWRAMSLDHYDGTTWRRDHQRRRGNIQILHKEKAIETQIPDWYVLPNANLKWQAVPYRILLEPTHQSWVYALEHSVATGPLLMHRDLSVRATFTVDTRQQMNLYWLKSEPLAHLQLTPEEYKKYTDLPQGQNLRSQALATQMFNTAQQQPQRYAQAVLQWIRKDQFSYTLQPPKLGEQRVDDFLFNTKAGFCEHYASSYVNLMRMVGIPARVVVGYQGGQLGLDGQSWEVRQLDAHAWTEVWFEGQGWVRIDPTAAIAPDRIQYGMQDYSASNQAVYGDNVFGRVQGQWLIQLRKVSDYANYQWQSKIVGYDQENQREWLKQFSIHNVKQQIWILLGLIVVAIMLMVWWLNRGQRQSVSALDRAFAGLSVKMTAYQLQRQENEPILTWLTRIEQHFAREHGVSNADIAEIKQQYTQHIYWQNLNEQDMKKMLKKIDTFSVKA